MDAHEAQTEIFKLMKRANDCLRVGAVDQFNEIQTEIARLQASNPGAVTGRGEESDINDHRA